METDAGLKKLREPFLPHQISKLPKPTRKQTEDVSANYKLGIRCEVCGGWHHKDVIHLDYVGHAALTDRLLDVDPMWNWEPMALDQTTLLPAFSKDGLWIKLTVCGVTRLGFGDAQGKTGPNAIKEMIGDALRNAGMRFGMALDLWHKGDLHVDDDGVKPEDTNTVAPADNPDIVDQLEREADLNAGSLGILCKWYMTKKAGIAKLSKLEQKQINGYVKQLKDVLNEKLEAEK